ncbi:MAG: Fibronectin-binding domain protein [Firmicutes bacterium]|nr:Fibronectin-binding domain protein [Bacillota bacterium]
MNIDGLSLSPLVTELDNALSGGRVDKIFQPDKYTLILWIRQTGITLPLLISANPEHPRLHLATAIPENPPSPPVFTMLLRKHLEDGRIAKISQHGLDRCVSIYIDVRGERGLIVTKELVFELMGKHSNIILVQDKVITDAIRRVSPAMSRVRQILPGREFSLPPAQDGDNLLTANLTEFITKLVQPTPSEVLLSKAIVQATVGIGPATAREAVWRAGLPLTIPLGDLDNADLSSLEQAFNEILTPLKQGETQPCIAVANDNSRLLGMAAFPLEHLTAQNRLFPTMSEAVEFAACFAGRQDTPEKTTLSKFVCSEITRLERKLATLRQELATAEDADILRKQADILMANIYVIPPRATQAVLPDLYADDPETATLPIPLDPMLSALENAQHYYAKYNKFKRAQHSLATQLEECQNEISYLDSIAVALEQAVSLAETGEIRQELIQSGYIKEKSKRRPAPLSAPLTVTTPDGLSVLIGKNNRQNDVVTFKHGRPDELWFHTKDIPGSHVILKACGAEPSLETINLVAGIAAYFSKARQSATVPVDYTKRRYVKKPAGAKPGFVIYDHQKTIYVTPQQEIVEKLIENNSKRA